MLQLANCDRSMPPPHVNNFQGAPILQSDQRCIQGFEIGGTDIKSRHYIFK